MNVKKLLLGIFATTFLVALGLLGLYNARVKEAEAGGPPPKHLDWVETVVTEWGECIPNAECGTSEGTKTRTVFYKCKDVVGVGSDVCEKNSTKEVVEEQGCEVQFVECKEDNLVCHWDDKKEEYKVKKNEQGEHDEHGLDFAYAGGDELKGKERDEWCEENIPERPYCLDGRDISVPLNEDVPEGAEKGECPLPEPEPEVPVVQEHGSSAPPQLPVCTTPIYAPIITSVGRVDSDTVFARFTTVADNVNTYYVWYGLSENNLLWNTVVQGEYVELSGQELVGRHVWLKVAGVHEGCEGPYSVVTDP